MPTVLNTCIAKLTLSNGTNTLHVVFIVLDWVQTCNWNMKQSWTAVWQLTSSFNYTAVPQKLRFMLKLQYYTLFIHQDMHGYMVMCDTWHWWIKCPHLWSIMLWSQLILFSPNCSALFVTVPHGSLVFVTVRFCSELFFFPKFQCN